MISLFTNKISKVTLLFSFIALSFPLLSADCTWTGIVNNNWSEAGNWSCGLIPTLADDVFINSAMISLEETASINALSINSNTTISGSGTLNTNGLFTIADNSEVFLEVSTNCLGQVTWGDAEVYFTANPILIEGEATLTSTLLWFENAATLTVTNDGILNINETCPIFGFVDNPTFIINGILNIDNSGLLDFEAIYLFENASINIIEGTLVNYLQNDTNCVINSSTVNISPDGILHAARILHINDSTVLGGGKITQSFGSTSVNGTSLLINIDLEIQNAIFNCNESNHQVNNITVLDGRLVANDNMPLVCQNDLNWEGGSLEGLIVINGNAEITDITPSVDLRFNDNLILNGGGSLTSNDNFIGTVTIGESTNDFTFFTNEETRQDNLIINGTAIKEGSADLVMNNILTLNETANLIGNGRIEHVIPIFNNGTIAPNSFTSPLILQSAVSIILESTSTLEIDLEDANNEQFIADANLTLNGELIIQESGNVPASTYTIISSTGTISGTFSTLTLPDNYTIEYLANEVRLIKEIAPLPLNATTSVTNVTCFGGNTGEITVNATGGEMPYQYTLIGVATQESNVFTSLAAGNYDLLIMDATNLTVAFSGIVVNEPSPIIADAIIEQSTLIITAFGGTGALQYSLDCVNFTETNVFNDLPNGDYSVCVMDENGCMATVDATVNAIQINATFTVNNISCFGEENGIISINATGGDAPYMYSINGINFQENNVFEGLTMGEYECVIMDANGITSTAQTVQINEPTPLSIEAITMDNTVTINGNGGTGNLMYSIDGITFSTENLFESLENNTYEAYIQDENNCTISTAFIIDITSIHDTRNTEIQLFPNPVTTQASLIFSDNARPLSLTVFNSIGKKVHSQNSSFGVLEIGHLVSGRYFIRIEFEGYLEIISFLKIEK